MYFVIYAEDTPNSFEKRRSVRNAHLLRLNELEQANRLLMAGPMLKHDDSNPAVDGFQGSLIIADFPNLASAKTWAAADPYVTADVYARVSVFPFKKVLPE
jgi:uncharacterized protein YciI